MSKTPMIFAALLCLPPAARAGSLSDAMNSLSKLKYVPAATSEPAAQSSGSQTQDFHNSGQTVISDDNSNARDIYKMILGVMAKQGIQPQCKEKGIYSDEDISYEKRQECSVRAEVPSFTLKVNDLFWGYSQTVKVDGETVCWQKWVTESRIRGPSSASLWYYCKFKKSAGTGKRRYW
ncbi:MAG: hypothetical protein ACYCPQ_05900 [Elusimicrobiota bacterium]